MLLYPVCLAPFLCGVGNVMVVLVTEEGQGKVPLVLPALKMANKALVMSWLVHKSTATTFGWTRSCLALSNSANYCSLMENLFQFNC